MSRTLKSIVVLLAVFDTVMCVVLLALHCAPEAEPVTAAAQPAVAYAQPVVNSGVSYLPLVLVHRGEAELVVVVDDPAEEMVLVERPVKIEKPVTDPCDSRNNPDDNPDPHPCPKRHSGQADEHSAPWPTPEPAPSQPKHHQQQQSQPEGGKRGG